MTSWLLDMILQPLNAEVSERSRLNWCLVCLLVISMTACGHESAQAPSDVEDNPGKGDSMSASVVQREPDQRPRQSGEGKEGGILLISTLVDPECLAYPISDRLLLTSWLCVADCPSQSACGFPLITTHADPIFYGLTQAAYRISSEDGASLALLEVAEGKSWSSNTPSASVRQGLMTIDGGQELIDQTEHDLIVTGPGSETCELLGMGLFNVAGGLVGMRSDEEKCGHYLALAPFMSQLNRAIEGDLSTFEKLPLETTQEPESDSFENEPEENAEEALWSSEEDAAEAEASTCTLEEPTYCVGDVEMSCQGGVFKAFHCQRVDWKCTEDARWGYGCHPAEF